ncbi:MAG: TlpA family protein disulfide reductase [Tannerella sp.]|jgi:peroxiredoxin|nr:TlpA family protein disulfide reductase [Tannerella sp.]
MKKNILLLNLFILFSFAVASREQEVDSDKVKVGDIMPAFTIVSDNGSTISSSIHKGKVLVVTMFATWCPPCQLKLAEMEKSLWPRFKEAKDFSLLVIGREHTDAELVDYNKTKGFTFPLYPDKDRKIFDLFAVQLIPRTYLINKEGKIIYMTTGYNEEEFRQLERMIERALN